MINMYWMAVLIFFGALNDFCCCCEVGFYGESCSKKCPKLCVNNECNVSTGNCLACVDGYFSNDKKDCMPCPKNCTICASYDVCHRCKNGFRGNVCEIVCSNCKQNTNCDKHNGYCFEDCTEGLSGELCNIKCDPKCKSCDRDNKDACISCADDANGKICKEECVSQCLRNMCNESHESCAYECSSGYRAETTCNMTCLSYCEDIVCNITCKDMVLQDRSSSSTSKAYIGLIMGLVIGFVIICICITVYIVVRRRSTTRRNCWCMLCDTNRTPVIYDEEIIGLMESKRTAETRELPSAEKLAVLQMQETFITIEKKYREMKISVDEIKVTVEGRNMDILNAFEEINMECEKIKRVQYKHSKSREWLDFFQKKQTVEYIMRKLEQKQIYGIWNINGEYVTFSVYDISNIENFKNTLLESVVEISVPVEKSLLASEWWGIFLIDIRRIFQEKVFLKVQQGVVIICTDDVMKQVTQMIIEFLEAITDAIQCEPDVCEFVSKYWTRDDFDDILKNGVMIKTEANGFKLRGLLNNLIEGKQKLDLKLKNISSKKYFLERTGIFTVLEAANYSGTISHIAMDCRCVIKLSPEIDKSLSVSGYEHIDAELLTETQQDFSLYVSPICFQTRRLKIKVHLIQGEIVNQQADIIVVGAASNHDLRSGSAFFSSLKQGGPQLETNYNRLYPNGIQDGEVAVIDPGVFNCDKIYLTSLPPWQEATCIGGKVLRTFMRECLRLADKYDKNTIAFSSSVTGRYMGYPVDMAVSIMYGTVIEFDSSYSNTSLKVIKIILDKEDEETIKAFEDHEQKRIYGASSVGSLSTDFAGGRIKIELVTGDIFTQKVDAILCSVSSDMNLTESDIFKSLVQKGGNSLKTELILKYSELLNFGNVVDISGGKLSCKNVFLSLLPPYSESYSAEKILISTLQAAFQLADSKGYTSVAIPTLETCSLNRPVATATMCMYDGAINWACENPDASLKLVRFVICSQDNVDQRIYRICHLKTRGREIRTERMFIEDGTILINPVEDSKYRMIKDGCAIGKIQLQVQVGDLLNNKADAIVIGDSSDCITTDMNYTYDEVTMTDNETLEPKRVIHVPFQDSLAAWRSILVDCLGEAGKESFQSVALPLFRSEAGPITFQADGIGECLFAAIDDFSSQNPKTSVTDVRLVVPDTDAGCIPAVIAALQARTTAVNVQWGSGNIFKSQLGFVADSNRFKNPFITVHSDAEMNIDRCIKSFNDRIGLMFASKVVDADMNVSNLMDEETRSFIDSDILVDVQFDEQASKFSIDGPLRNVLAAVAFLHNKMRQYKLEENSRISAKILYDQTKWHWLYENKATSEKEIPYDMLPNFVIEKAYKDGNKTVELQSKDGKIYVIDFQKLVEYPKENVYDTVVVIRKDILKDVKRSDQKENWKEREALNRGREYQIVEERFLEELRNGLHASKEKNIQSVEVIKIERIRNKNLSQQYKSRKGLMEQNMKDGCRQIHRRLWHETDKENIDRIINNGFNRSYCKVHEHSYGQGVYFAADASFYVLSNLAENKPGAKRYMFLAEVLTGQLIKGHPSMRVLPLVDPADPNVMYDTAVDDVNSPMQFVIFHVTQANPKYLITYTSK